jgi:hypothetical protein
MLGALSACTETGRGLADIARAVGPWAPDPSRGQLIVGYQYLRVVLDGQITLFVLGYRDSGEEGPVEVWYGGGGRQLMRLVAGRVISTRGFALDWQAAHWSSPAGWSALVDALKPGDGAPVDLTRTVDEMPGHRYGLVQQLQIVRIPPPQDSALADLDPRSLVWFAERDRSGRLPSARYALEPAAPASGPLYGEWSPDGRLKLSWQRWGAQAPRALAPVASSTS